MGNLLGTSQIDRAQGREYVFGRVERARGFSGLASDGRGGAPRPNRRADERAFVEHREAIACAAFVDTAGRRLSLPVFIVEINAVLPAVASDAAWFADLGARVGS
jgi:hypothetical protein